MAQRKQKRHSKFQPKKLPLKQRLERMFFRSFPYVAHGIKILAIISVVVAIGMIGRLALTKSHERKATRIIPTEHNDQRLPVKRPVREVVDPFTRKLLTDALSNADRADAIDRLNRQNALNQSTVIMPQAHSGTQMQDPPQHQVIARYPMWDAQSQSMVSCQFYADGHQETDGRGYAPQGRLGHGFR